MKPVSALDVAAYILHAKGSMSAMKLQKLVYYSQAWSLVWDDVPLFTEKIEAWRDGPVVKELFKKHKGQFLVGAVNGGDRNKLDDDQEATVLAILDSYGGYDGATLSQMAHDEAPWQLAREGVPADDGGSNEITHESMKDFYGAL